MPSTRSSSSSPGGGGWSSDPSLKDIETTIQGHWKNLTEIWAKIGVDPSTVAKRKASVVSHTKTLFVEMVEEEEAKLRDMVGKVGALTKEMSGLLRDLSLPQTQLTEAMTKVAGKTLMEQEGIYLTLVEDLRRKKAARMEKYDRVNKDLVAICGELEETVPTIQFDGIPSDKQVSGLQASLSTFQNERASRIKRLVALKSSVVLLFKLTEKIPRNSLERFLIQPDDGLDVEKMVKGASSSIKVLSSKVLKEVEGLQASLLADIEGTRTEAEEMFGKIKELQERLKVDEGHRRDFEAKNKFNKAILKDMELTYVTVKVFKAVKQELAKLEKEKLENLSTFIQAIRSELTQLWHSKAFMSEPSQRFSNSNYEGLTQFSLDDFEGEDYTEELLDKHEAELGFWREWITENAKIIDMINKRESLFSSYRELDQKSDDPSRLNNRGGALLKEQKERSKLEKQIPKLEKELVELVKEFNHGDKKGRRKGMTRFLVFGHDVEKLIEKDWEELKDEREKRRETRRLETAAGSGSGGATGGKTMVNTTTVSCSSAAAAAAGASRGTKRGVGGAMGSIMVTPNKRTRGGVTTLLTPGKIVPTPSSVNTGSTSSTIRSSKIGQVGSALPGKGVNNYREVESTATTLMRKPPLPPRNPKSYKNKYLGSGSVVPSVKRPTPGSKGVVPKFIPSSISHYIPNPRKPPTTLTTNSSQNKSVGTTMMAAKKLLRKSLGVTRRRSNGGNNRLLRDVMSSSSSGGGGGNSHIHHEESVDVDMETRNRTAKMLQEASLERRRRRNLIVSFEVTSMNDADKEEEVEDIYVGKDEVDVVENDQGFARPFARLKGGQGAVRTKMDEDAAPSGTPVGATKTIGGGGSRIPMNSNSTRKRNMNQVVAPLPSPDRSYTEFTDHLMGQSTLNSSTMSTVLSSRKPLAVVPSSAATAEEEDEEGNRKEAEEGLLISPIMAMDQD